MVILIALGVVTLYAVMAIAPIFAEDDCCRTAGAVDSTREVAEYVTQEARHA